MILLLALSLLAGVQDEVEKARALIRTLDSDEAERREAATAELGTLARKSDEVNRLLEKAAESGSAEVRRRAEMVLEDARLYRHAARIVPDPDDFLARLKSTDNRVRDHALRRAMSLGKAGAPLAALVLAPADPFVSTALRFVGMSGDASLIPKVRPLLAVPNLRPQALDALSRLGDPSIRPDLRDLLEKAPQATSVIVQLGRLRHPDDIALFRTLILRDDPQGVQFALEALQGWTEAQRKLSEDIFELVRQQQGTAVLLALDLRHPRLLEILRGMDRQNEALFARAVLGDRTAIPHLLRLAKNGPASRLGLWGLGVLKAPEAVWMIERQRGRSAEAALEFRKAMESVLEETEVYGSQHFYFRKRSASFPAPDRAADLSMMLWMLGEIGGADAERIVLENLADRDERIRHAGCAALGRMGSRAAEPELLKLLDDALAFSPYAPVPLPPRAEEDSSRAYAALLASPAQQGGGWVQVREAAVAALETVIGDRYEGTMEEKVGAWKARRKGK